MRETLERERKLDVDGEFSLPELPGSALDSRVFTSTYPRHAGPLPFRAPGSRSAAASRTGSRSGS